MHTFRLTIAPQDKHFSAIGRVAVLWSFLENEVEKLVWTMAPLKQLRAQAVTRHIGNVTLYDVVLTLANLTFPSTPLETKLKASINLIENKLRPERNRIIHGIWGPHGDPDKLTLIDSTARGTFKFEPKPYDADKILAFASQVDNAAADISDINFEIAEHLSQRTDWP